MVSLIPLFAVETLEPELLDRLPGFRDRLEWFSSTARILRNLVSDWKSPGLGERRLLSLLRGHRMKRVLPRMLDETEFLSDYGVRSLSQVIIRSIPSSSRSGRSINRCATSPANPKGGSSAAIPIGAGRFGFR